MGKKSCVNKNQKKEKEKKGTKADMLATPANERTTLRHLELYLYRGSVRRGKKNIHKIRNESSMQRARKDTRTGIDREPFNVALS